MSDGSVPLTLGIGEVHVWQVDLDHSALPFERLGASLAPGEWHRADRFRFGQHRRRFVTARGVLRWLLGAYLDVAPPAVALGAGPAGKPELAHQPGSPPVSFNCSHSRGQAVYAMTLGHRIGVDVEAVRPIPEALQIAADWFAPGESAELAALTPAQRDLSFLHRWTAKEACAKARGDGITGGLDRINLPTRWGDGETVCPADNGPASDIAWQLTFLSPAPGYVAALVVEGHGPHRVSRRTLDPG